METVLVTDRVPLKNNVKEVGNQNKNELKNICIYKKRNGSLRQSYINIHPGMSK